MKNVLLYSKYYVVFAQNNDIQLSMILEMNNQPKSVYYSYEEKKTKKAGVSAKMRATTKGR